jgi:hypothetical protein
MKSLFFKVTVSSVIAMALTALIITEKCRLYEIDNTINESFLRGSLFSVGQESLYFSLKPDGSLPTAEN